MQRQTQKDALLATARTIARTLPNNLYQDPFMLSSQKDPKRDSYAYQLRSAIVLDGFDSDWELTTAHRRIYEPILKRNGLRVSALIGKDKHYIYLHLQVSDEKVIYPNPQRPRGDEILISTFDNKLSKNIYTLSTTAPGPISVSIIGENPMNKSLAGFWHETVDGYNVELRIPSDDVGIRLGFVVRDVDTDGEGFVLGSLAPTGTAFGSGVNSLPGILRTRNPNLEAELQRFVLPNLNITVIDNGSWEIAKVGSLTRDLGPTPGGFLARVYRILLDRNDAIREDQSIPAYVQTPDSQNALAGRPASHWARLPKTGAAIVAAAYPIKNGSTVVGALRLEQYSRDIMLLGNADSVSFISRSLLLTLGVALMLLGYATYLSIRVQRLRNTAEDAVSAEGKLKGDFPASNTGDEIGDLSRSFSTLLQRVQDYTNYLEGLAGRLSHELRTPLTIVRSSLDNLSSEDLEVEAEKYTNRAREGVTRLGQILTAMSESNRLEQSIQDRDIAEFDLVDLLRKNTSAFSDIYPEHQFNLKHEIDEYACRGSPDLISQLLEKLVNNAVDFTDSRKQIGLELGTNDNSYNITIWNYGSELPSTMIGRLFDSMVSIRAKKGKVAHLGLGLHIAKMIAEFHQGSITASNLENDRGAKFVVTMSRLGPKRG